MKTGEQWLEALEDIHNAQLAVARATVSTEQADLGGVWDVRRADESLSKAYREALEKYGAAILTEYLTGEASTVA
jgi:hypothetical protein